MKIRESLGLKVGAAVFTAAAGVALSAAPSAFAVTQGTATLVDNANNTLTSGTLSTPFSVNLSAPGVCSGTSAANGYFVYSFVVPVPAAGSSLASELAGITWSTGAPSQYYPLIDDAGGDFYGPVNTSTTGQPLAPPQQPQFGYLESVLQSNSLPLLTNTTWEVGLACEHLDVTQDYWATQVTFDADGNWTVGSQSQAPEVPLAVIVPVVGIGVLGGGYLFTRRRNRRTPTAP